MLYAADVHMKQRDYLANEFSGADIMTGPACTVSKRLGADISDKPHLEKYIDRCNSRSAMRRAWTV